jgi:hypothetical protein
MNANTSYSVYLPSWSLANLAIVAALVVAVLGLAEQTEAATPPVELTEGNASQWGAFATDGAIVRVTNDSTYVKAGSQSIKFNTASGFDTGVRYPRQGGAHWDLEPYNYLVFWIFAVNPTPIGFQNNQPVIVLKSPSGSFRYDPQETMMFEDVWHLYRIPLAGDADWVRTAAGSPDLGDITQIEIHHDTWDAGFTLYYDGMRFAKLDPGKLPPPGPPPPEGVNPDAIAAKLLLFIYDPIVENAGGRRLHDVYGWGDPVALARDAIADLRKSSHGLVRYRIAETRIVDAYPRFTNGFRFNDSSYAEAIANGTFERGFVFDYNRFINVNGIASRIESGAIDEVWVYGAPGFGMYESTLAGAGGYWLNSPPVAGAASERLFVIMGLNYERGVAEAIHSYGHRAENTLIHSYGPWLADRSNNWNRFTLTDQDAPGLGAVGNVHNPVNAEFGYDYGNTRYVLSEADDWYNYPNFTGQRRLINHTVWIPVGVLNQQRAYLNWWYGHIPHFGGRAPDYYLTNWWRYIVDVDQFKAWNGNLYLATGRGTVKTVRPAHGSFVSGTVRIEARTAGFDQNGAVGRVDFYIDGKYRSSDNLTPYTFHWNTAGLAGIHRLVAKAYELQNGTQSVAPEVTVRVIP